MATPTEDIIYKIKQDHKPLKEYIRIICSEKESDSTKIKTLKSFFKALDLHTKAEEAALYENIVEIEELRDLSLEGFEEHDLADILVQQLKALNFEKNWSDQVEAKAKVFAEVVKHHIDEEEADLLPELKQMMNKDQLLDLGEFYSSVYAGLKAQPAVKGGSKIRRYDLLSSQPLG